jgi:hypothetical protein
MPLNGSVVFNLRRAHYSKWCVGGAAASGRLKIAMMSSGVTRYEYGLEENPPERFNSLNVPPAKEHNQ